MPKNCVLISNQLLDAYLAEYNKNLMNYLKKKNFPVQLILYRDDPKNFVVNKNTVYICQQGIPAWFPIGKVASRMVYVNNIEQIPANRHIFTYDKYHVNFMDYDLYQTTL